MIVITDAQNLEACVSPLNKKYLSENDEEELEENPLISQTKITTPLSKLLVNKEENEIDLLDLLENYILYLSNTLSISLSNIKQEFNQQAWQDLVKDKLKFLKNVNYYIEIETILEHLFGSKNHKNLINLEEAHERWITLRSLSAPTYNSNFSYEKDDWNQIIFWVESEANPILQTNCGEHEWSREYIYPIFKVNVMEQQVKRGHQMDILCIAGTYEVFCGHVCGNASYTDLTKLSNDEFDLIQGLKDMLSYMINKFDSEQN
ncbi:8404_t:CDS:2 [Entrophospora sp. SA101]|nr:8404_t:CDS:2 [Entrophospora sp. SA101]